MTEIWLSFGQAFHLVFVWGAPDTRRPLSSLLSPLCLGGLRPPPTWDRRALDKSATVTCKVRRAILLDGRSLRELRVFDAAFWFYS